MGGKKEFSRSFPGNFFFQLPGVFQQCEVCYLCNVDQCVHLFPESNVFFFVRIQLFLPLLYVRCALLQSCSKPGIVVLKRLQFCLPFFSISRAAIQLNITELSVALHVCFYMFKKLKNLRVQNKTHLKIQFRNCLQYLNL